MSAFICKCGLPLDEEGFCPAGCDVDEIREDDRKERERRLKWRKKHQHGKGRNK